MTLHELLKTLQGRMHPETCCERVMVKVAIPGTNGLWFDVTDVSTFSTYGPRPPGDDSIPLPVVERGTVLYAEDPKK